MTYSQKKRPQAILKENPTDIRPPEKLPQNQATSPEDIRIMYIANNINSKLWLMRQTQQNRQLNLPIENYINNNHHKETSGIGMEVCNSQEITCNLVRKSVGEISDSSTSFSSFIIKSF